MPRYEHWYRPDRFERGYDFGYLRTRQRFAERPWVGSYVEGYQGGSQGVELGTDAWRVWQEWADQRYRRVPERQHGRRRPAAYARDYGHPRPTRASAYGYDFGYGRRGY
jgi:hypothetical protein